MIFGEMGESFGIPQAQKGWSKMNPGKIIFILFFSLQVYLFSLYFYYKKKLIYFAFSLK